ncbi:MAG: hypothetical protein MUF23_00830 [Pirellula sp.]|nr:hypothetical protein [Pirellula sp.]
MTSAGLAGRGRGLPAGCAGRGAFFRYPGGMKLTPRCDPLGIEQRIGTMTGGIVPMTRDSTTG